MNTAGQMHASVPRMACFLVLTLCSDLSTSQVFAQATPVPPKTPLADYVGTYADKPGHTIEIIAGDDLFAVIDEATYRLKPAGKDLFAPSYGDKIPFLRDNTGKVIGYEENGKLHARLSPEITAASAALARPRPLVEGSPVSYHYAAPEDWHDGIAVGPIDSSDLDAAAASKIVGGVLDGTWKNLHSILLYQHGHLVLEEYFYGYSRERAQQLRSATKSVVSTLAGIAIDRGALSGVDEPVLPHMAYTSYANPDPRKSKITLGNFLAMSSGLDCNDHDDASPGRETVIDETPDWVKATLDLRVANPPGTKGFYCSGGVAVVGRMVENATRMYLPDFAQANLFAPLGIARSDWFWNYNLTNKNREYSQIHLRPRDMLKLGLLFAEGGRWQGKQIVSSAWVKASLRKEAEVDGTDYGYFWWRPWLGIETSEGTKRVYLNAAQGNGGQKIYIVPEYELVAVFTGGDYNSGGSPPNKIMTNVVLPVLVAARAHARTRTGSHQQNNAASASIEKH